MILFIILVYVNSPFLVEEFLHQLGHWGHNLQTVPGIDFGNEEDTKD